MTPMAILSKLIHGDAGITPRDVVYALSSVRVTVLADADLLDEMLIEAGTHKLLTLNSERCRLIYKIVHGLTTKALDPKQVLLRFTAEVRKLNLQDQSWVRDVTSLISPLIEATDEAETDF